MANLRYLGTVWLAATLELKTGLHIGAGKDAIEIGGIDNPVIRHPISGDPYVPGSSLKGKARFLLEWAFGKIRHEDGRAFGFNDKDAADLEGGGDVVLRLFGTAASRKVWGQGPTRLIVRDAPLNAKWRADVLGEGRALTEEKAEVSIDRVAGKALDGGLRRTERVPAGARFDVEIGYRMWDTGDGGRRDREALAWFIQALHFIELDALGGSGSRGYGQVAFRELRLIGPERMERSLDNVFRASRFDPKAPPAEILALVDEVCAPLAQAA